MLQSQGSYRLVLVAVTKKGVRLLRRGIKNHSDKMAEGSSMSHREKDGELLYPVVDTYGPITIRGSELEPGKKKKWCTCGLSKKAPWCDGAHKKTGFRSLKWEVPEKPQSIYQICNCKYTKSPPYCDGTHTNLPEEVLERQKNCPNKPNHEQCLKMCTGCGIKVDF
ncbi:CDGSH iron-sulfur domain-containing protein 3, mitochondrial-like [Lytechinus variegatus]|uniref:CDGSH iron-sulfur domain-containing protein 3, mitochondrial-like n=1 Tax=Lytechinus variegatus TaxID=7654 RepID=UPI001BB2242D|nr:CDGSH iron-sulfur domain-containing protein 3, mitochondrial-like [Lytechinus variegatus]XP_041482048.1 CDGSH iron-sulfur domain-containing protein 3, mitochondrial-like [Lytechinus variegatus]